MEETDNKNVLPREEGDEPSIVDEIRVEELAIDGICGVY